MQSAGSNTTFTARNSNPTKGIDYLIAIAGWPTLFSVSKSTYTLATCTGPNADKLGEFTGIQKLANCPTGGSVKFKGRPEDGGTTIANLKFTILDKRISGSTVRNATDLVSRHAYLLGNKSGNTATLSGDHTASTTTITLSASPPASWTTGTVIHIGQEAVRLGSAPSGNAFTSCTRGYRLTTATPHLSGVKVYDFMPNLHRRSVYVFKGYQDFTSTATFLRCFGGVVIGDEKAAETVAVTAAATTWELYGNGTKKLARLRASNSPTAVDPFGIPATIYGAEQNQGGSLLSTGSLINGDYSLNVQTNLPDPTILNDGHYMLNVSGVWMGIASAAATSIPGLTTLSLVRGLGSVGDSIDIALPAAASFGWSNAVFSQSAAPTSDEPLKLILKMLLSVNGDGTNDATYDVYRYGIGLGIPAALVDQTSFTAIMANTDYDSSQKVAFPFTEPVEAKKFIEEELCKPFGYSLITGNDGRIKVIQHRSPQVFSIGAKNNQINVTYPATSGGRWTATLGANAYTPSEMATEIARALNAAGSGSGWGCTYSTSTKKFTITNGTAFDLRSGPSGSSAWATLGFTSFATNTTSTTGDNSVGSFPSGSLTLSASDMMDLTQMDSRDLQIAQVVFAANYDWRQDKFLLEKPYIDAEAVNLGDQLGGREYRVESKGLMATGAGSSSSNVSFPWHWTVVSVPSADPCAPPTIKVDTTPAIDVEASWAHTYAYSLLHRYKQPPMVLKARLIWKHNLIEIGDVVKLNYSINGVIADYELDSETLSNRNFEVAAVSPNWKTGQIEVVLVGHRYQGAF